MIEELILSPEELYYLAKACHGKHLNYDYIAMIPDIQQRGSIYQDSCTESLEGKGLVADSWGEVTVSEEAERFLAPLWNGEFESSAAKITLGDQIVGQTLYIHRQNDQLRLVNRQKDGIHILALQEEELEALAYYLMPDHYIDQALPEEMLISEMHPKEMILLKNIQTNGEAAMIEQFYLIGGWICRQESENSYRILSAEDFYPIAVNVLKGV